MMMKNAIRSAIIAGAILLAAAAPGRAQLSQSSVDNDIQTQLQSCGNGCNTAATLRALLDIMVQATFQSQGPNGLATSGTPSTGQVLVATGPVAATWGTTFSALMTFSLGLYSDNFYTVTGAPFWNGSALVSGSPLLVLSNVYGGASQGPGLLFNSLNSASVSLTSHYINCGFSTITEGSEIGTCDEAYRAPSNVNQILTTAVNNSSAGCRLCNGNTDNFWTLGTSSVMYANIFGRLLTTGGYLISGLPTCNSGSIGSRAYVTNGQTTPGFLGTVSTTGSTVAPVFCNGAAWVYGG